MDDRYIIDTPENIEFAYDVAGIGSRFLAAIFDTLLIVVLQVALGVVVYMVYLAIEGSDGVQSVLLAVWAVLSFLFLWGYYIVFELIWNGQSPGKRIIGLRVVRTGGRPITFVGSAIRNLVRVIDFLPGFYGLGVVVMFIDGRSRRLGDLAAGTLVVKEQQAITLDSLTARGDGVPPPLPHLPGEQPPAPTLPNVHLLTTQEFELVQEFLQRRATLGRESRARLGVQLAQGLRSRLGLPSSGDPELFLEHVAREYRLHVARGEALRR
jgi:uncharacterized RDD family membrane protein YckC